MDAAPRALRRSDLPLIFPEPPPQLRCRARAARARRVWHAPPLPQERMTLCRVKRRSAEKRRRWPLLSTVGRLPAEARSSP